METQGEKIVWRYGVQVLGIKKRGRKPDWHHTDKNEIGETDTPSELEAKTLAQVWINQNMKTTSKKIATATKWKIVGPGMEQWEPFTKEDNLKWEI